MRPTPPTSFDRTRRATDTIAVIAICGFLFFVGLQVVGLIGPDEPRYAQVAREMLTRHEWVTPYLYGVPWLEKPPLYYWCAIIAYSGSGQVSDTAARLPAAILSCLLIIFIYVWARRFRRGMQLDAALITASAAIVTGFGRSASTDMPLTVMFALGMLCWYGWYTSNKRGWLLGFYLFLALGTLAKGPVAVFLALIILIAFAALRRDGRLLLRTFWPMGIALYFAVAAPWFVVVQHRNPEFLREFFLQQNLERYTSNLYHHPEPFWFFVVVGLLGLIPWTVFAIAALVDAIRSWRFSTQQPAGEEDFRTYLALWFLLPIIFFSFSQAKLAGYILPAIPAATILLADFISRRERQGAKPPTWQALLHGGLCAAMLLTAFILPFKLLHLALPRTVIVIATALAIMTLLMLWATLQSQGYRMLRFATLVPLVIAVALVLRGTAPMINMLDSERPVAMALSETELGRVPDLAVYDVGPSVQYGLAFYRNRRVNSYENKEIPAEDHIVVAAAGAQKELEYRLPKRRVVRIGGFPLQNLDFYFVSKAAGTP